jgi:hypothetical protein
MLTRFLARSGWATILIIRRLKNRAHTYAAFLGLLD